MPEVKPFHRILIIQTAFLGDVVLAMALVETLALAFPRAKVDFLLRKGNEHLLENNPHINQVIIWDKKRSKFPNLFSISKNLRQNQYSLVLCLQRYLSGGVFAVSTGAGEIRGFSQNPLSTFFSKAIRHTVNNGLHEVDRNHQLLSGLTDVPVQKPRLYPGPDCFRKVAQLGLEDRYIVLAPSSVWFTKMWPKQKWAELITLLPKEYDVCLIGSSADSQLCQEIISMAERGRNFAGQLTLLESAALISRAQMTYTNDSGPLHLASAMNAPATAIFCSTVPGFGFGPLSDVSHIIQESIGLQCRPCGLHGYTVCPQGHFLCATTIPAKRAIDVLENLN